ncbi:MAG: tyrosine-type recombinase/integrase [Devosia sp.]
MLSNKLSNIEVQRMRRTTEAKPHKRAGIWYLVRRIPAEFAHLDRRSSPLKLSTDIAVVDDPKAIRARQVVTQLNQNLEAYWRALRDGQSAEARIRFEAAQKRAKALGVNYQTMEELRATGRIEDVLTRVELLVSRKLVENENDVAAVLGGEERPRWSVSDMTDEYEKLQSAQLQSFSPAQRKRWKNPKAKAVKNFLLAVGDKFLDDLTRADAITFREWWQAKLVADGLEIGTANKDFGHMNKMHRVIDTAHHLALKPVFSVLRLEGETTGSRAAFLPEQVAAILDPDNLRSLNDEARDIVYVVAETGMRPSEVCGLLAEQIQLAAKIPHVQIKPIYRKLKNPQSERDIPLVGAALEAMRRHPEGFPTYQDKADTLSATVNKALRKAKLQPTPDHTLYSLRHAFEDRLIEEETPDKVVASLMGHKFQRPKYGKGPTLDLKLRWLEKIAFPVGQ